MVDTTLCLDTEYNKALLSVTKDKAQEKARKGRHKACNNSLC